MVISNYRYAPLDFFALTFIFTWVPLFYLAYLSFQKERNSAMVPLLFFSLAVPFLVALTFIFGSGNSELIHDFLHRLLIIKMDFYCLLMLLVVIPGAFFLSTALSLLFGKSKEQFNFSSEINVIKGWQFLSLLIPILLAPLLEELGWRGYGVDSLTSTLNPLIATLLFGILWSLWHLPLFFINGYYQYELRSQGAIYVANFFASVIPLAVIFNWLYFKTHRSILIIILAHALCNALVILFKTEQFTKTIFTVVLSIVAITTILLDSDVFLRMNY